VAARWRTPSWLPVVIVAALVYSWIAAALRPFTAPEDIAVAIPVIPVVVLAVWWRPSPPPDRTPQRGAVVWMALFGALAVWELAAYVSSPRDAHPTLSSIGDSLMSTHLGRAIAFAVWLGLGAALAFGRRRERPA
jgi:hypothetical protein